MTSPDVASTILRRLGFADATDAPPGRGAARLDFDGTLAFPDLPYDAASVDARYPDAARAALHDMVDAANRALAVVPAAGHFVAGQLAVVLLRRSATVGQPTSSSNRTHVGVAVLTNVEASPDPALVCAEALVHESVHQFLYRLEREHGPFCDLDATRRYRSPWSGNRIPLHSLVHAAFVYHALLAFWSRYAAVADDVDAAAFARDRVARSLFGYGFLDTVVEGFPRGAVDPAIVAAIRAIADAAAAMEADGVGPFAATLAASPRPWLRRIASAVAALDTRAATA